MWAIRVWRFVDLKEKMNLPLYYPLEPTEDRTNLFDLLVQALLADGQLTAYDDTEGNGDEFLNPMDRKEIQAMLEQREIISTIDPDTDQMIDLEVVTKISAADVVGYKLKEDHIFDKQRGVMEVRIMGIAPVVASRGDDGEIRGHRTLFWLYYPESRHVLASSHAFLRHNDAEQRTFDEIFTKRLFSGRVTKVSNVYDRGITDHRTGIDALLTSEDLEKWLAEYEMDLWHY